MKYFNKSFQISYGSKEYQENWEKVFQPQVDKKVLCLFWDKSPWSPERKAWSLHATEEDAKRFCGLFENTMLVERSELVMITKELYDKVYQKSDRKCGGGLFVRETDFISTQMELFK